MTPSSGLINLLDQLTELRKTVCLLYPSLLQKDMIRDPDGRYVEPGPGEEARSSLVCPLSQHFHVFSNPEAL